jgi:hypothetical protein
MVRCESTAGSAITNAINLSTDLDERESYDLTLHLEN